MKEFIVSIVWTETNGSKMNILNGMYRIKAASKNEAHGEAFEIGKKESPNHSVFLIQSMEVT
jgi:hypothetical protein